MCGEDREHHLGSQKMVLEIAKVGGLGHIGMGAAEGAADSMFDKGGMTSGVFHGLGNGIYRQARKLRQSGIEVGNQRVSLGETKAATHMGDLG